ncbi:MAG: winged helix DNA-binding domain-containing protein, partial [Acidimicrobiia bacterium]
MRSISNEERRSRLAYRHRLAKPASNPVDAARSMVALHSSDPATVFLSVQARVPGFTSTDLEQVLYENRSLVRMLGMRRTMWVVPRDFASVLDSSSAAALVAPQLKRTAWMVESGGITSNGAAWYEKTATKVLKALDARGEATARELTKDVPELAQKVTFYKKDGGVMGEVGASTRVLFMLATEGRIIRARPLGTWISSQYRWSRMENWLGAPLEQLDPDEAQATLVRSWLRTFGPATVVDIKWWTGWTVKQVRTALQAVEAVEVTLGNGPGYLLGDDVEAVTHPGPWVALLPSLDPTTMGWKERDWYLGDEAAR